MPTKNVVELVALVLAGMLVFSGLNNKFGSQRKPPTDYSAHYNVDVLMYGAVWCGYCAKARRYMDSKGITYYEHDIDKPGEGREQYDDLGGKGVPLFQVGGEVMRGYSPGGLQKLVNEKRLRVSENTQ